MICTDIRISVSFKDHRKRKRLRTILGPGSTDYILDLWIATAMNHPSGVLSGMDELDIALEAGWQNDPMFFVEALIKCGFLEKNDNEEYQLHDWVEHQEWVTKATERKEHAQKAAEARWSKASNAQKNISKSDSNTPSIPEVCSDNAPSIPEAMPQPTNQPIKTNIVSSVPEEDDQCVSEKTEDQPEEQTPSRNNYPQDFLTFFQAYPKTEGSKKKAYSAWKKARDKPSLEQLLLLIEKSKQSERWQRNIIPHPETWLNQARWETVEVETPAVTDVFKPKEFDPRTIYGDDFEYPKTATTKH